MIPGFPLEGEMKFILELATGIIAALILTYIIVQWVVS